MRIEPMASESQATYTAEFEQDEPEEIDLTVEEPGSPEPTYSLVREVAASEPIAGLSKWTVTVTDQFEVTADSIDGALFASRTLRPNARITSIQERS
jgi:hypothetical protein